MVERIKLEVDNNRFNSKTTGFILGVLTPEEIIIECNQEILSGLYLNSGDLWAYIAALEMIADSLKIQMDEAQNEVYKRIKQKATTITFVTPSEKNPSE